MIERRKFLTGLISLVAAPAIVRAGSLMPVKAEAISMTAIEIVNLALKRIGDEAYGIGPMVHALPNVRWAHTYFDSNWRLVVRAVDVETMILPSGSPVTSAGTA